MKPRVKVKAQSRPMLTVVQFARKPSQEVQSQISEFAAMADDGRLISVAVAAVHVDGSITTGFVAGGRAMQLAGAVQVVRHRLMNWWME